MTAAVPSTTRRRPPYPLALRFAWRELRGGLRGFAVFLACIALGVMAISGVGSLAASLTQGLAREGRVILGGDADFTLIQREAGSAERAFLASRGRVSQAATLRAMAKRDDGQLALVEIKAVDDAYPLYGKVTTEPAGPLTETLAARDGVFGAAVDPTLLTRLGLPLGARVSVGAASIELRSTLVSEPDRLAGGIGFGPRLLISEAALRATGLLQPGSLVRWHYRLRVPDAADRTLKALVDDAKAQFPQAGWDIRTWDNASPQLARNVERFTQFLTLVGLTALLVGGVGVANAVGSHLERKRDVIATYKALGASGGRIFAIFLVQVMTLAAAGSFAGMVLGAALPFLVAWGFGALIPLPLAPALHAHELALALLYGLMTALAFALWPLGRAHDVPVAALFRGAAENGRRTPRRRYLVATAAVVLALAALAIGLAFDRRIAAMFVAAAAATFLLLRIVAWLLMRGAAALPRPRSTAWRLAIANIHRPGALTPSVVLSLGLGLALLVTVVEIDGNLRRQFMAALPDKAPAYFFIDIPAADAPRFEGFLRGQAPTASVEEVPMLRGRIVSANGVPAEALKPTQDAAWVLQSDRGITYADDVPQGSRVVEGRWWPRDYDGPPLVSFEKKLADGLGLRLGDRIAVNVLGRDITARIANLRSVDWQNLGINFVMVFSPNAFRGAPHTHIATLTYPPGGEPANDGLTRAVADSFPTVTAVRVKEALDAVGNLVVNLVLGIRAASIITLLAAVLVLGGALAAGHRHRVYDAVILKTLGATRARLLGAYALEYLLLGLTTAVFGVVAGSIAAWLVVTRVMTFAFVFLPSPAFVAALAALAVTIALGLAGTFSALGHKPAPVLRDL